MPEWPLEEEKVILDCCLQRVLSEEEMLVLQERAVMTNICLICSFTDMQGMSSDIHTQSQAFSSGSFAPSGLVEK